MPEQEQALVRGLAVEPKQRWQSISGLYAALYHTVIKDFPWLPEERETELVLEPEKELLPTPEAESEQLTEHIIQGLAPTPELKEEPDLRPKQMPVSRT